MCRIPCLILCLADVERVGQCRAPNARCGVHGQMASVIRFTVQPFTPTATSGSSCNNALIDAKVELPPATPAAATVFRGRPRTGPDDGQTRAVEHEMDALAGRDPSQTAPQMLTAPGERRIVRGGEVEAHHPEQCVQESFGLAQREMVRGVAGSGRSRWRDPSTVAARPAGRSGALLHESSLARTMPIDRILTCRCDTTLVGRGRSSD